MSANQLPDMSQFDVLDELKHDAIVPFVQRYMRGFVPIVIFYYVANILCLGLLVGVLLNLDMPSRDIMGYVGLAVVVSFVTLFIHEHIHGLAYRYYGAKNVTITFNWRNLIALCTCDLFLIEGKKFVWVGLAPFIVISVALVLLTLSPLGHPLLWTAVLMFHTSACSGDFALVNYIWLHRTQAVYTYDDNANKTTFFVTPRTQQA